MTSAAAAHRIDRVRTADGVTIALHRIGDAHGIPVLLVPGTFSNHTFWLGTRGIGFARALAEAGFEAWALDPRGHGHSDRPRADDQWDFDAWARRDLPAALAAILATDRRPFIVGHSAGGSAALACIAADARLAEQVRGIIVAGTPAPWLQPFRGLFARAIRFLSRRMGRFPARFAGIGPEDELPGVMSQWMGWNIDGRWTGDDGTDYAALLPALRVPALAVAGGADRMWAPPRACRTLFDLLGSPDKQYLFAAVESGFSQDFDHAGLLVSRAARTEIWPRLIDWMRARS
jgi:pimeloyl-ACP methyl ester carboxylesterase